MIDAKELRIGNWIKYCEVSFMQLDAVEIMCIARENKTNSTDTTYEPIPITEEILEKCGKKIKTFSVDWYELGDFIFKWSNRVLIFDAGEDGQYFRVKIKSFHHLQNLYFALTGKEINYQP